MDITIRRMRSGDADELYRLLSDPVVMRYLEPPYDRVQTEAFLHDAGLSEPPLVYAVQEDERFIGYVIYHEYDADSMEIGWVLFPEYWGRGYASELTDRLIDRARQAQKDVVIECVPEQTATMHLAGKKGFRSDGVSDGLAVYRLADRHCGQGGVPVGLGHPAAGFRDRGGAVLGEAGRVGEEKAGLRRGGVPDGGGGAVRAVHAPGALRHGGGDGGKDGQLSGGKRICERPVRDTYAPRDLLVGRAARDTGEVENGDTAPHPQGMRYISSHIQRRSGT